jgi:hypothetical protein
VRIEDTIMARTARTPSGGGFWLKNCFFHVRYGSDWWEWKYRGNIFYDLQDLADEILRRSGAGVRLTRHYLQALPVLRKGFRRR